MGHGESAAIAAKLPPTAAMAALAAISLCPNEWWVLGSRKPVQVFDIFISDLTRFQLELSTFKV
jgi:hypothetical protein